MVVIAQLAEHRIVVPSVVGSSPTLHPEESHPTLFFCFYLRARTRVPIIYIIRERPLYALPSGGVHLFLPFPLFEPKNRKNSITDYQALTKKMHFF